VSQEKRLHLEDVPFGPRHTIVAPRGAKRKKGKKKKEKEKEEKKKKKNDKKQEKELPLAAVQG